MGQSTSLAAPFDQFNAWSVREVEELRKKYFLMDLNFGLSAEDVKDWLDVDGETAHSIMTAFNGSTSTSSGDRISAMNLLAGLALCVRGEVEEKVQVLFACFDFDDLQKLDSASLGVLFLAAACGSFALLRKRLTYPKSLVRALVKSVIPTGSNDTHIGAFRKWCDEKLGAVESMKAAAVVTSLGFSEVFPEGEGGADTAAAAADAASGEEAKGADAAVATATATATGSGSQPREATPLQRSATGHAAAAGDGESAARAAAVAAIESFSQLSAMYEKAGVGAPSPAWTFRGPLAEAQARAGYAPSSAGDADAVVVD
jgi:hypothetical protein